MSMEHPALIESARNHGPLTAREALALHPELSDTARALDALKSFVRSGQLAVYPSTDGNTRFGRVKSAPNSTPPKAARSGPPTAVAQQQAQSMPRARAADTPEAKAMLAHFAKVGRPLSIRDVREYGEGISRDFDYQGLLHVLCLAGQLHKTGRTAGTRYHLPASLSAEDLAKIKADASADAQQMVGTPPPLKLPDLTLQTPRPVDLLKAHREAPSPQPVAPTMLSSPQTERRAQPSVAHATDSRADVAERLGSALLDLVSAERLAMRALLAAAHTSTDETVRRLAQAADALRSISLSAAA